jgi:hypothetical protein
MFLAVAVERTKRLFDVRSKQIPYRPRPEQTPPHNTHDITYAVRRHELVWNKDQPNSTKCDTYPAGPALHL